MITRRPVSLLIFFTFTLIGFVAAGSYYNYYQYPRQNSYYYPGQYQAQNSYYNYQSNYGNSYGSGYNSGYGGGGCIWAGIFRGTTRYLCSDGSMRYGETMGFSIQLG